MGKTAAEKPVKEETKTRKRASPKMEESKGDEPTSQKRIRPARGAFNEDAKTDDLETKQVKPRGRGRKVESPVQEEELDKPDTEVTKPKTYSKKTAKAKAESPVEEEPMEATNQEEEPVKTKPTNKRGPRGKKAESPIEAESETLEIEVEPVKAKQNNKRGPRGKKAESPVEEEENKSEENETEPTKNKPVNKRAARAKKAESPVEDENEPKTELATTKPNKRGLRGKKAEPAVEEMESESVENREETTKGKPLKKRASRGKAKADMQEEDTVEEKEKTKLTKKKATKAKPVESPDEEEVETSDNEVKENENSPTKKGKPIKAAVEEPEEDDESSDKEVADEPVTKAAKKSFPVTEVGNSFKIVSWNVGGIRAVVKKEALTPILDLDADIICMQEVRCPTSELPEELKDLGSAYSHKSYVDSAKGGYAGCATWSKIEPISVQMGIGNDEMDTDGRAITLEFDDYYLVNVYVPNAGRKLATLDKRLRWNGLFAKFCADLDKIKPVIITGDMNVSHKEIDLARPKANVKNAGFTIEERDGMTDFLALGFVDAFRHFYPEEAKYTFWAYMGNSRAKNIGWRLDYFLVSERFIGNVKDSNISSNIMGSDHCPVVLHL